jgi:tetratricopeptide (TPR) repeat protein
MKKQGHKYYIAAAVSVLTFVVYLATLGNDFVEGDDKQYVLENLQIRSFDAAFFRWAFFDFYAANWHPLTWISHALDYAVWGLDPVGHHLTNNILHAVNTFLVVLLVVRLIEESKQYAVSSEQKQKDNKEYEVSGKKTSANRESSPASGRFAVDESSSSGKSGTLPKDYRKRPDFPSHVSHLTPDASRSTLIVAGVTGLLFGLHPIHVESVAWVAERKDLLCALFYLLSVMAYIKYATRRQAQGDNNVMVSRSNHLSLLFFILALMSKPMAVSLPVVLLILDWYPLGRITSFRTFGTALIGKVPFIALSIGSSIITLLAQEAGGAIVSAEAIPLSTRLLVAAQSLTGYLWKMLAPFDLLPLYPYPGDVSLSSPEFIGAVVLAAGITAAAAAFAGKSKLWLSAWLYYFITLVPVLGIVQVGSQPMADRYTYLPGLGPFILIGVLVSKLPERLDRLKPAWRGRRLFAATAVILIPIALSVITIRQIAIWKDGFTLWSEVIAIEPEKIPLAYNNRGLALYSKGQLDRAIEDFDRAVILDPYSYKAYLNRGAAFVAKGRLDRAAADFDKAIALNPSYPEAYNAKGSLFGLSGYPDKAIEQFSKAIEINPGYSAAYGNRGTAYLLVGRKDRALEDIGKAIGLDPYYAGNYLNRGKIYLGTEDKELAFNDFQKACELGNREGCSLVQAAMPGRR